MPTTCGYCSVGCGIEIGVKDGRAVASRPLASHPVNRGKLCPKGLSEHYTIRRREPRQVSAAAQERQAGARRLGRSARTSWSRRSARRSRSTARESLGVLSTGQLVTEEFYTLGKLVQLGFGTNNYDGNTTLCMASAVSGYKTLLRQRRPSRRLRRPGDRPTSFC